MFYFGKLVLMQEARRNLEELNSQRQNLQQLHTNAENRYHKALVDYLGISTDNPLASFDEEILSYTDRLKIVPSWFTNEIDTIIKAIQGFSPNMTAGWFWRRLPLAETSDQFLNAAINIIRARYPSSREHDNIIAGSFKKAAEMAGPDLSEAYTWLNDHRSLLYDIHSKYWKEHDKKEAPTVLDPKGLTPILESDIKSVRDRHVWIEILYGENNQTKADELKAYLESVGYEVTFHFEGAPDLGEPSYPVSSRVRFGSLLHSLTTGSNFRFYEEAQDYVEGQQKQFEDRLKEVLTDTQKSNIDLYKRFLNPVTTLLTLGTHWLNPDFVDNKLVYLEGVVVGFSMEEAVQLVDAGLGYHLSTNEDKDVRSELSNFLDTIDFAREKLIKYQSVEELISIGLKNTLQLYSELGQETVRLWVDEFLRSDSVSILERPNRLKHLYENLAYRIYRPY